MRSRCRRTTRSAASISRASNLTTTTRRSLESRIPNPEPRFVFFGGKGGVGKTTCACAFALAAARPAARRRNPARVLLVSTDPAHSLGDALGVRLSSTPRRVRPSLDAVELDAPRAFARWLAEHRRPLADILEHGTWLDAEDVDALLDLSIPGVDELVGMLEIARLAGAQPKPDARLKPRATNARYDRIVVDTAPTGHTLRLLVAPETVAALADVLDSLQLEHRLIRQQLARVGRRPEAADTLITILAEQARDTAARLRDAEQTVFHWVTLPEALSVAESEDAITALERTGLGVRTIVVNRVTPVSPGCPVCERRRADEGRVIAGIRRRFGRGRVIQVIPAAAREPRGLVALAKIAGVMAKGSRPAVLDPAARTPPRAMRAPAFSIATGARAVLPESVDAFRGARLLFFGGKGGVGKTTVAAAVALRLARIRPGQRILLLSTDPAHSVADVFAEPSDVGDRDTAHRVRHGPKNLRVRELDAPRALASRRALFEGALDEIAASIGALTGEPAPRAGSDDNAALRNLMNLAPPGIDELFGILSVVDARDDFDTIVIDTAPTGHALRLLEMPEAAREWTQVLLRVLLKYRSLVRPGQLASELVDVSKSIRELQTRLRDHAHSRFIVVTRAADLPRLETERLLTRLRRLDLATPAIVVNALTLGPYRCPRCRATAAAERGELTRLMRRAGRAARGPRGCAIIQTPLSAPPPRGVKALDAWAEHWTQAERQNSGT